MKNYAYEFPTKTPLEVLTPKQADARYLRTDNTLNGSIWYDAGQREFRARIDGVIYRLNFSPIA